MKKLDVLAAILVVVGAIQLGIGGRRSVRFGGSDFRYEVR